MPRTNEHSVSDGCSHGDAAESAVTLPCVYHPQLCWLWECLCLIDSLMHTYLLANVCACVRTYVCACVRTYVCMHVYVYVCICVCVRMYVCPQAFVYVDICMYLWMCVYAYLCVYVHMFVCKC